MCTLFYLIALSQEASISLNIWNIRCSCAKPTISVSLTCSPSSKQPTPSHQTYHNYSSSRSHEEVLSLLKRLDIQDGYHGLLLTEALSTFLFRTTPSEVTKLTRNVPLLGHQEVLLFSERFEIHLTTLAFRLTPLPQLILDHKTFQRCSPK